MRKQIPVLAIIVFYVIAVMARYITEYTFLASNLGNPYYEILTGIGPAIGAFVASVLFRLPIPLTLQGKFKHIWIPLSVYWLLPVMLLSVYSYFTTGTVSAMLVLTVLVYGLCEEIGWRGFLREALKPLPKFAGILVLTLLWYIWHLNFGLDSTHFLFFAILMLGSWGLGVVADKTNSLLALAAFHSLNNFFPEVDLMRGILLLVLAAIWIVAIILLKTEEKTSADKQPAGSSA